MQRESLDYDYHERTKESYEKRNENLLQNIIFALRALSIRLITLQQVKKVLKNEIFEVVDNPKILDVGCRRGDKSTAILDTFSEILDNKLLLIGGDLNIPQNHTNNFVPLEMLAEQIPFVDNSFEVITAFAVHHHFFDIKTVFAEMERVLKPGGILLLVDTHALKNSSLQKNITKNWLNIYKKYEDCGATFNEVTVEEVRNALDETNFDRMTDFWSFPLLRVFLSKKKLKKIKN